MNKLTAPITHWLHLVHQAVPWIGLLLLAAVFIFSSLGSAPLENPAQRTATPQPVLIVPGPTPLPAEYFRTQDQSNLITFGAVLLVLIILISALSALTASRKRKK